MPNVTGLKTDPRVDRALTLMMRPKVAPQIDWEQIARRLNLSSSRFRHLFKLGTGISAKRYLKMVRLRRQTNNGRGRLLGPKPFRSRLQKDFWRDSHCIAVFPNVLIASQPHSPIFSQLGHFIVLERAWARRVASPHNNCWRWAMKGLFVRPGGGK
jgi:hypothetical protein